MQVRLINVDMAQCQRHDQSAASWLIVYANGMQLCQSPAVPGTTAQHHTLPVIEGSYTDKIIMLKRLSYICLFVKYSWCPL